MTNLIKGLAMYGHTTGAARRNRRIRPKATATAQAIRRALALSAALLALGGSGLAMAQSCNSTATLVVTCNGAFTDSVETYVNPGDLVADLTLVIGTDGTSTVNPPANVTGLTSTWGGDAVVITYADMNTSGADGVYMYSDDTATLTNDGAIYTAVTASG